MEDHNWEDVLEEGLTQMVKVIEISVICTAIFVIKMGMMKHIIGIRIFISLIVIKLAMMKPITRIKR